MRFVADSTGSLNPPGGSLPSKALDGMHMDTSNKNSTIK